MDFIDQQKSAERIAWIIKKCYSEARLAAVSDELGVPNLPCADIFQTMVLIGKTPDYSSAVSMVARHLDLDRFEIVADSPHF